MHTGVRSRRVCGTPPPRCRGACRGAARRCSVAVLHAAVLHAVRCALLRVWKRTLTHTVTHPFCRLARSAASRLHAAIVHHPSGKVYIIELNATHGTLVDSLRLEKHRPLQIKDGFRRVHARRFSRMSIAPLNAAC
jgi:hypothetical protein